MVFQKCPLKVCFHQTTINRSTITFSDCVLVLNGSSLIMRYTGQIENFWAFEYENAICVQSKWYVTICYFFLENLLYISPPYMSLIYEKLHVLVNLWVIKFTKFGCWNKFSSWSLIDTSKKYDFILDSLMYFSHYLLGHVCALLSIHVRQCTQK